MQVALQAEAIAKELTDAEQKDSVPPPPPEGNGTESHRVNVHALL